MQTTLLGLAIAAILALVAALVGPAFVDWGQYRATFESEATRFVGQPVRIGGAIDVRLLPTPTIVLRDVEIGVRAAPAFGAQAVRVELALDGLMRGELHAASLSLTGPEVAVALDTNGRVVSHLRNLGIEQIAIDKLAIVDGRLALEDAASHTRVLLDKLNFSGEVRAQSGQVKGGGDFAVAGRPLRYQLTTGRRDAGTRVRLSLEPADRPLTFETEGSLTLEQESPKFEGTLSLARPAGVVLDTGKTVASEPWRLASKVNADVRGALLEQIDVAYGPDERRIRLGGTAEFKFGARPRFDGVLSARQVDLDRALAVAGAGARLPLTAINGLIDIVDAMGRPPVPVSFGVGVDAVTLGGATVQALRADVKSTDGAWSIDTFEFRAPGATQVRLSGRLGGASGASEFSGPVVIDSADPAVLMAWLEGTDRRDANFGPLKLRSDISVSRARLAFERLTAEIDRKTLEGRLAYAFASGTQRAKLDVAMSAAEFDVEAAYGMIAAALAGSKIERPGEVSLAVDLGRTTFAGIAATSTKANLKLDAGGLRIERLAVADFGGAALSASGQIDIAAAQPSGNISLNLAAPKLDGVTAVIEKFFPGYGEMVTRHAVRLSPARIEASLSVDPPPAQTASTAGKPAAAKISLNGQFGNIRLALSGDGIGTIAAPAKSDVKLNLRVTSDDGAIISVLGLENFAPAERRATTLTATANGSFGGDLRIDGKLAAEGFDLATAGTLKFSEPAISGALTASVVSADLRSLRRAGPAAFPVAIKGNVKIAGNALNFSALEGKAGGAAAKGQLSLTLPSVQSPEFAIDGKLVSDAIDVPAALAAILGAPPPVAAGQPIAWPAQPFAQNIFADLRGRIEFDAARATWITPVAAQKLHGVVNFGAAEVSLDNLTAMIGGGTVSAQATFQRSPGGLTLRGKGTLTNADATAVIRAGAASPVAGRVSGQVSFESVGTSPAALIAGLRGTGSLSLENAKIAGLDWNSIDAATRAVERGTAITPPRLTEIVGRALDAGSLALPSANAPIEITNGRVRLAKVATPGTDGVTIAANLDFVEESFDARVTLLGSRTADVQGLRPELTILYKGPPSAPRRTIDVSALMSWLTLQSVERESKKLEVEEREHKRRQEALEAAIQTLRDSPQAAEGKAGAVTGATPPAATVAPLPGGAAAGAGATPGPKPTSSGLFAPVLPAPQLIPAEPKPAIPAPSAALTVPAMPPPIVVPSVPQPASAAPTAVPAERIAPVPAPSAVTAAAPSATEDDLAPTPGALPETVPLPPRRPNGHVLNPVDLAPPVSPASRNGSVLQHNAPQ